MSDVPPLPKELEDELVAQAERDTYDELAQTDAALKSAHDLLRTILSTNGVTLARYDGRWVINFERTSTRDLHHEDLKALVAVRHYVTLDPDVLRDLLPHIIEAMA